MNDAIIISEIPPHEAKYLARETLRAVERFFAIPGTQEKYEIWLKEYNKRQAKKRRAAKTEESTSAR